METGHTLNLTVQVPDSASLDEQGLREYLAEKLYGDAHLSLGDGVNEKVGFPNSSQTLRGALFQSYARSIGAGYRKCLKS